MFNNCCRTISDSINNFSRAKAIKDKEETMMKMKTVAVKDTGHAIGRAKKKIQEGTVSMVPGTQETSMTIMTQRDQAGMRRVKAKVKNTAAEREEILRMIMIQMVQNMTAMEAMKTQKRTVLVEASGVR